VVFFGCRVRRGFDGMAFFDQRVQVDHFEVVTEGFHDGFAAYTCGEGGDVCEDGAFRHFGMVFFLIEELYCTVL
jgi:hypothetical protein